MSNVRLWDYQSNKKKTLNGKGTLLSNWSTGIKEITLDLKGTYYSAKVDVSANAAKIYYTKSNYDTYKK